MHHGRSELGSFALGLPPNANLSADAYLSNQVFSKHPAPAIPSSSTPGSGDVVGPASATDKAIATFNTATGKLIQNNSTATIGATGLMTSAQQSVTGFVVAPVATTSQVSLWAGTAAIVNSGGAANSRIADFIKTPTGLQARFVLDNYTSATNWAEIVGTASAITSIALTATDVTASGTISAAQVRATGFAASPVATVSQANIWGGTIALVNSTGAANSRITDIAKSATGVNFRLVLDNYTGAQTFMSAVGSGSALTSLQLNAPLIYEDSSVTYHINGHTAAIAGTFALNPRLQLHGTTNNEAYRFYYRWSNDAGGSGIYGNKSRGGIGTHTVVAAEDVAMQIGAGGSDGTNFEPLGLINFVVDGTPGNNDMPGRIDFYTTPNGSVTTARRFFIDNAGNVVVNTAAIATTATDGFLYVPTCAGTPTGAPTAYTGRAPIVVDTTNNKLYFYSSGAWRDAGP